MGGPGSGRHFRLESTKDTVEDCSILDIFRLVQKGTIAWDISNCGTLAASGRGGLLSFSLVENKLRLQYKRTGHNMDYCISLTRTYPHFGGYRLWFLCPHCQSRAGKLYLAPGHRYYLCRKCADVTYQSTREMSLSEAMAILQTPAEQKMSLTSAIKTMQALTRHRRALARYIR